MRKIAIVDEVHSILIEKLSRKGFDCVDLTNESQTHIESIIHEFIGIVIRSKFPLNESFLKNAVSLEFIARSGAGMENIDIDYCNTKNIELFNAPEGNRNAVGEHALGMLLSLFNNLNKGDKEIRRGVWDREGNRGIELEGKTVGLVGYGNNGKALAKKMQGFEVRILAYDKYKTNFSDDYVQESSMKAIFEHADILSFHIPQNEETIYLADDVFFRQFKKKIYLINLSRGKIVKTKVLVDNLKKGKVKGACLDVLEYEKTSFENVFSDIDNLNSDFKYLLNSKNVILSPHVGGWTIESYYKLSNVLVNKILKFYNKV